MKRLLLAFAAFLWLTPAQAQVCPTVAPYNTADNRCASTQFVQNAIAGTAANLVVGTTTISAGTSGRVLYDNAGVLGEYPITGTAGNVVLSTNPTIASPTFTGTVAGANTIPLTILQQSAANTMLGNWTGSTANVLANAMPSCPDTGGNRLNYLSGTGIVCGAGGPSTAITALTGDVTATGPGSVAATLATAQPGLHTWALLQTFTSGASLGVSTGTSLALGGATIGANALAVTGSSALGATSIAGLTVTSSFTATGLVGNASLVNPATTVNGQTCTLGSTCTVTAAATSITVGTTTIASGTTTRILYDNAGVLGEYTLTGTGTVVAMQAAPTLTGAVTASGTLAVGGCSIGSNVLCVTGSIVGSANIWSGSVTSALTGLTGAVDGFRASAANVTQFAGENTTASSSTQGAFIGMYSNDGAAMASGDRLGGIRMGGSSSASALRNSTLIAGFASQTWVDASAYGSRLEFQTTTNTTTAASTKLILGNAGLLVLGATEANTVPALKPNGAGIDIRLGDDSAAAALTALTYNGNTLTTGTYTLTGTAGKTLNFTNSLTLSGTDSTTMTFPSTSATIARTVASGAKALGTGAISSATCATVASDTATGTLTTDAITVSFNGDPTAVTGYTPVTSGALTIFYYPTADNVNFKVCNLTAGSITPGAVTINWRVVR